MAFVAASPAERFVVIQLVHAQSFEITEPEKGRLLRKLVRQLDLGPIREVLKRHGGVSRVLANEERLEQFQVEDDVLRFLSDHVGRIPRRGHAELLAGELFDRASDAAAGRGPKEGEFPPHQTAGEEWTPLAETGDIAAAIDELAANVARAPGLPATFVAAWDEFLEKAQPLLTRPAAAP